MGRHRQGLGSVSAAMMVACCSATPGRAALDCGSPVAVVDFAATTTALIAGDTAAGAPGVSSYSCDPGRSLDGPEQVIEVLVDRPGHLFIVRRSGAPQLKFLVTSACDAGACAASASDRACAPDLAPGRYFVVVDSPGTPGPYELTLAFEDALPRWSACQAPRAPTTAADTASAAWHFADGAYCVTDPANRNFPNGCTFALYLAVPCGKTMTLELSDVESATVRVVDVLDGRPVELDAVATTGFTQSGTTISWEECAGPDPDVDDRSIAISFDDPNGLCGVFRLELVDVAGWDWSLHARCEGGAAPGPTVHDSACGALAAWQPRPSLTLVDATTDYACPDFTVTYRLRNDGCAPATNVDVVLWDGPLEAYRDVMSVAAGSLVTRTIHGEFPYEWTLGVTLEIDPDDDLTDCAEAPGAACAAGTTQLHLPECNGPCQVFARATQSPSPACVGEPMWIDASSSTASSCPNDTLQYRLLDDDWNPLSSWSSNSAFLVTAGGWYFVEVRCADARVRATCKDMTDFVGYTDRRPGFGTIAAEPAGCGQGIRLTWWPGSFGPFGQEPIYNVYRSVVSCEEAVSRPPLATCVSDVSWTDGGAVAGVAYHYVVEAEVNVPGSACGPPGPCHGGPVSRLGAYPCASAFDVAAGVVAAATVTPQRACSGQPVTVDASSSRVTGCPNDRAEYQVVGPGGVVASWRTSPVFSFVAQPGEHRLEVRCGGSGCADSIVLPLAVEAPPTLPAATVIGQDVAACSTGIALAWGRATFASGSGTYNVYRSEVSCLDAMSRTPVASCLTGTVWVDVGTAAGGSYVYVVEAEDGVPASACWPLGGCAGGHATRVPVVRGACEPIVEVAGSVPAELPRVGATLRLGEPAAAPGRSYGPTFVILEWATDRPLATGEHFHVLRSAAPDSGFRQITTEGFAAPILMDTDAAHDSSRRIFHYLVVTADACDVDNLAFDTLP